MSDHRDRHNLTYSSLSLRRLAWVTINLPDEEWLVALEKWDESDLLGPLDRLVLVHLEDKEVDKEVDKEGDKEAADKEAAGTPLSFVDTQPDSYYNMVDTPSLLLGLYRIVFRFSDSTGLVTSLHL